MREPARNTKECIVDAAITLFADKGYFETSMKDIAAAVGIKSASIYNHFRSKDELLGIIMEEYILYTREQTVSLQEIAGVADKADPAEMIEKMFFTFSKEDAPRYTMIYKVIIREQFREPKATEFIRDYILGECQDNVQKTLDLLVAAKRIRPIDTAIYAKLIISLTLASSIQMSFYGYNAYQNVKRVPNRKARSFLIDQIIHGVE